MNIEIVFEEVMELEKVETLTRKVFEKQGLEDLYAAVERHRLPVAFIFVPHKHIPKLLKIPEDGFSASAKAPRETVKIQYIGMAWGTDYYEVKGLDAIYAVTVHKFLKERGSVARLVIAEG